MLVLTKGPNTPVTLRASAPSPLGPPKYSTCLAVEDKNVEVRWKLRRPRPPSRARAARDDGGTKQRAACARHHSLEDYISHRRSFLRARIPTSFDKILIIMRLYFTNQVLDVAPYFPLHAFCLSSSSCSSPLFSVASCIIPSSWWLIKVWYYL